jgi:hypothetical protein
VRSILMEIRFTLLSLSVVVALDEAISPDRKIFQEDRSRCRDFRLSFVYVNRRCFPSPAYAGQRDFLLLPCRSKRSAFMDCS